MVLHKNEISDVLLQEEQQDRGGCNPKKPKKTEKTSPKFEICGSVRFFFVFFPVFFGFFRFFRFFSVFFGIFRFFVVLFRFFSV